MFSTLAPSWPVTAAAVDARAQDYYALADSQIVMGPRMVVRRLTESPAPLYLAAYSEGVVDLDRVGRLAVTAFQRTADYFGSVPFPHYTIHQELLTPLTPRHEYGMSMEHLGSSTYYLADTAGLTAASSPDDDARVLYNFAHHIAHAWVPKRAYGDGYFPFQWELAPVLDSIWFAEGFGQYAAIMAVAAGTPDPAAFRTRMLDRRFRANVTSAPAFLKRLPLVDLSRVASTRYAEDFRTGRLVFSRGGLMAAAIDDRIQAETKGAKSLRDALRYMVAWTAREHRAFSNEELPALDPRGDGRGRQPRDRGVAAAAALTPPSAVVESVGHDHARDSEGSAAEPPHVATAAVGVVLNGRGIRQPGRAHHGSTGRPQPPAPSPSEQRSVAGRQRRMVAPRHHSPVTSTGQRVRRPAHHQSRDRLHLRPRWL